MTTMTDEQLLSHLGECLMEGSPAPQDDPRAWMSLQEALVDAPPVAVRSASGDLVVARRLLRRPVAAMVAGAIVLSGGAAAAVGTNTLPGPLRGLASSLGLPVTSSALDRAQAAMTQLSEALRARDPAAVRAALIALRADLTLLDGADQGELGPDAASLIAQAEIFLAGDTSGRQRGVTHSDSATGVAGTGTPSRVSPGGHDGSEGSDASEPGGPAAAGDQADGQSAEVGEPDGADSTAESGGPGPTSSSFGTSDGDGGSVSTSDGGTGTSTSSGTGSSTGTSGSSDGGSTSTGSNSSTTTSDGSGSSGGSGGGGSDSDDGGSTTLSGSSGPTIAN